jgi:secreted Zn-dependent insulinase-like peptidase
VIPATTGKPLTYVYTTLLLNDVVEVHQSFAFHERESKASFAGVEFDIEANSVKWSLNFTSTRQHIFVVVDTATQHSTDDRALPPGRRRHADGTSSRCR